MDNIEVQNQTSPVIDKPVTANHWKKAFFVLSGLSILLLLLIVYLLTLGRKTDIPCGGFVGSQCPLGYSCTYEKKYPDALGYCTKNIFPFNQKRSLQKTTIIPSPTLTPQPTITQESTSTASWKTYENKKYNFYLKYPPDWSFNENNSNIVFGPLSTKNHIGETVPEYVSSYITLDIYTSAKNIDLVAFKKIQSDLKPVWKDFKIGEINGKEVKHLGCLSGNCREVLFQGNELVFNFFEQNNLKELDQILSTLKFLENQIDINIPGTESSFSGTVRETASRPAPDISYDYELFLDKPLVGITTGAGDNQTLNKIIIEGIGLNLGTYLNKHINCIGSLEWGYAESRILLIKKIVDSN